MFLNNICMSCNIIGHMYVMHHLTTYMWSLCNIFLHLSTTITPFVALSADKSVVQWVCQFIVSSKHLNCTILPLFFQRDDVFYLLCTRAWRVLLLHDTQRELWHLGWYICLSVCVHVVNGITTPCLEGRHIVHVSMSPYSSVVAHTCACILWAFGKPHGLLVGLVLSSSSETSLTLSTDSPLNTWATHCLRDVLRVGNVQLL